MPIKYGDRNQIVLLPPSVEEYVGQDDAVRAYDAFVEHLAWDELGIKTPEVTGRPAYDPKAMLKLLLYSYSYGLRSSRKIERACYHNLSFIWLMGNLKPDHKTIAEFRRNNKKSLQNILKQCVQFCLKCDLIEGNVLFVDGTKIRANASVKNHWDEKKCQKALAKIDHRIEELLTECETTDETEDEQGSFNKLKGDLANQQTRKAKITHIMQELKEEHSKSKNTVDNDCSKMRSSQGSHASYNVQHVVDDKNGLIVQADPVKDSNDSRQFVAQIRQAEIQLEKPCLVACADAGYTNTDELAIIMNDIKVIVPSQKQALHQGPQPFHRDEFVYEADKDRYICPKGHPLTYRGMNRQKKAKVYHIQPRLCRECRNFGLCTRSKNGRKLARLINEEIKQQLESQYLEPSSQEIYKRRKEKIEHPFGHIKRNLGITAFLLRGREGVKSEAEEIRIIKIVYFYQ